MLKGTGFVAVGICFASLLSAQEQPSTRAQDSVTVDYKYLPDVTVVGRTSKSDYQQMPEIVGTSIYAGKKNALIVLDNVQGNIASNTMRQVLAKVPGIHIWESDPSGIQIGIAARGLSPNRSWEFNVRQNGYDIAADPFGYPEAYYNPQLQAVQRIEVVRGQGSLQYGPQFGGLINYILRNGSEIDKKVSVETRQTVGSNALFNSYNAIGGKTDKIHYYSFFDHRSGNGWRDNSAFYSNAGFGTITWRVTPAFSVSGEVMHSHIRSQQPGGLTDTQIGSDARQSSRSRNWFDITWTTPAVIANYQLSPTARWNTKLFATIGNRNSVGYLQPITVKDSINPATLTYNPRSVQADRYRNFGMESRVLADYTLGNMSNSFSGGVRLYTGTTYRNANGTGTMGTEYDMEITGAFARDIDFRSRNAAAFAENIFRVTPKLLLVPGVRFEWLEGTASGRDGYTSGGTPIVLQNITRSRNFLLAGLGAEYHITRTTELYANMAQGYRPIQFANLQAPPTTDQVDPDLRDARGYNIDLGYRGKLKDFLQFDVSAYYLRYDNRIGTISVAGSPGYRLVTNVGSSTSRGLEVYSEVNVLRALVRGTRADLMVFASYSYTNARYGSDHKDAATAGKKVENAPPHILRAGITAGYGQVLVTAQVNYTDKTFSDANNTATPTANGNTGLIPSYMLTDVTASFRPADNITIKAGVNNLFDERYFTRRAGGYPGPGALPGDGRSFFLSVGANL